MKFIEAHFFFPLSLIHGSSFSPSLPRVPFFHKCFFLTSQPAGHCLLSFISALFCSVAVMCQALSQVLACSFSSGSSVSSSFRCILPTSTHKAASSAVVKDVFCVLSQSQHGAGALAASLGAVKQILAAVS